MNMNDYAAFKNLKIDDFGDFVVRVSLNRPRKYNALNLDIWFEIGQVFQKLDEDENCRCVILEGEGKHFSTGLDLLEMSMMQGDDSLDTARRARRLLPLIKKMQHSFTQIEKCSKPVLIGIHGFCLGAGIDIITTGDVRFATKNAVFSVKEVDIGMAADVGTLNRLPKCVGNQSWVKDISLTARHFGADEAMRYGLVSRVMSTREEMQTELVKMAKLITNKSPVGVQGTKIVLNYSRDHTVQDSLDFVMKVETIESPEASELGPLELLKLLEVSDLAKIVDGAEIRGFRHAGWSKRSAKFRQIVVFYGKLKIDTGYFKCSACPVIYRGAGGHTTRHWEDDHTSTSIYDIVF